MNFRNHINEAPQAKQSQTKKRSWWTFWKGRKVANKEDVTLCTNSLYKTKSLSPSEWKKVQKASEKLEIQYK